MKILWVTFTPIGSASRVFYNRPTQSGGWVDATLRGLLPYLQAKQISLDIAALDSKDAVKVDEQTGVTYRTVQMPSYRGKRNDSSAVDKWKALLQDIQPDVIQIWGTEFTFGLDILEAAGEIPVCFYIQGVMTSLAAHPAGDIPLAKLQRQLGLSAVFKFRALKKSIQMINKHIPYEREMVTKAAGILEDNLWTRAQYGNLTDKFYTVPLAANTCFRETQWSLQTCQKHSLFTVAGGACPQKGVHEAVLAVAKLKEKYPDIRLYIPGNISSRKPHFLYDSLYIRHLRKIICQYGLEENVVFLGSLKPEQMAQQMQRANAFVMPSCVETHSSSLREAMMVGCPSVSAAVGSVPELVEHGKNGFLYRYTEVDTLAYYIDRIFSDDALAEAVGAAGRKSVNEKYPQDQVGQMLMDAYNKMVTESSNGKN